MSLYNKYRPEDLDHVIGNEETVEYLRTALDTKKKPQVYLLHGETGCGKTTLARIIVNSIGCSSEDYSEINSADFRGIDSVRQLIRDSKFHPMNGKTRVWVIDEVHQMTRDAQNAMLKLLEEPPKYMYFIFCTTDPQKLLPTVRGRCIELKVNPLADTQIIKLLSTISKNEGVKIKKNILEQIALETTGHPRNAIQVLEKILHLPGDKQEETINNVISEQSNSIELCRALLNGSSWKKVSNILKGLKNQEPESIRRHVLGYAESALLKGSNDMAAGVIEEFAEPLYDVGFPGLVLYCYTVIKG